MFCLRFIADIVFQMELYLVADKSFTMILILMVAVILLEFVKVDCGKVDPCKMPPTKGRKSGVECDMMTLGMTFDHDSRICVNASINNCETPSENFHVGVNPHASLESCQQFIKKMCC